MDWSTIADWVSGIGSLLAVAVSLYFSTDQIIDKQKEKYAALSLWCERSDDNGWKIITVNQMAQPVTKWVCNLTFKSDNGQTEIEDFGYKDVGIIPPGKNEVPWKPSVDPEYESSVECNVFFIDSVGNYWNRPCTGTVKRKKHMKSLKDSDGNDY